MKFIRKIAKYLFFYLSDPKNFFATEKVVLTSENFRLLCMRENHIERSVLDTGFWEPLETSTVKRLLKVDDVVFDIGANIGYFTILMSRLVGDNGQVHCFEPTAYAFNRLHKNITINPTLPSHNLYLNNKGLSSKSGKKIESFESRFSSRLLAHDEKEMIEFITLDDYFYSLGLDRVDFIKIDVDGYDYEVIKGGGRILKKYRPNIMAEICNRVLKERGVDVTSYLELYLDYGYSTCEIIETTQVVALEALIKDSKIQSGSWNILIR
jgi:FkbM family methyltransferase